MKILDLIQGTREWKLFRSHFIGASDSPTICGVNPWSNPAKLWNQKMLGEEIIETESMLWGKTDESLVRGVLEKRDEAVYKPLVVGHDSLAWMFASLDGYDDVNKTLIEIKCTNAAHFAAIKVSKKIPKHYIYQVNHQMEVVGVDAALLVIFDGMNMMEFPIQKDDKIVKEILEKGKDFYDSMISFTPPEESHIDRPDLIPYAQTVSELRKKFKEAEDEYDSAVETLKIMAGLDSVVAGDHKLTKYLRKGKVNYMKIPELREVDLENYREKPSTCWKFT